MAFCGKLNCNCNCDLTKFVECLWHLRNNLEYDVKSLTDARKRLKYTKEQMRRVIENKARHGERPTTILSGWLERVEKLEFEELHGIFVLEESDLDHPHPHPHEKKQKQKPKQKKNTVIDTQESDHSHEYSQIPLPTTCLGGLCYKNWFNAYKYQRRVKDAFQRVQVLLSEQEKFNKEEIFDEDQGPADMPLGETIGVDEGFDKVWCCLQDEEGPRIIGIHGMGGVGKTTLLMRINNHLKETITTNLSVFDQVLWIDGLRGPEILSIQFAIGERLGLTWAENASQQVRGAKIKAALKTKRYLLLIDDLWKRLEFTDVGVPIETKVVFTTRNEVACSVADQTIPLECLREEDAWVLFQNSVKMETLCSNLEISPLAKEVAQLCGGLPLALVTVGSAMSCKRRAEDWNHAIEMLRIQAHQFADIDEKVYNKLRVGYEFLGIAEQQPCFLYCSLFPKGCLVEEEEMIHYWLGENLINGNNGALRAILNHGKSIITTLKEICLLKSGESEGTISMHDMVRGYAKWIASECGSIRNKFWVEYGVTLTELPTGTNSTQVERISLVKCEIEGSMILNCPNLSTLILKMSNLKSIRTEFFQPLEKLMVLDLSGCKISVLPNHVTSLTNLQYLNLSNTAISVLPDDFKNLEKLKFLDMSYINHLQMIPPNVISNLWRLKFLNLYHSGLKRTCRGVLSGAGEDLMRELDMLRNLEDLGITIKSDDAFNILQNSRIKKCTQSLFISNCEELESLQLPVNLKVLRVLSCLKLHNCLTVKQDSLRRIDIKGCDVLADLDWLKYARHLQFLRVVNCIQMKGVINECKYSVADVKGNKMKQVISECESSAEAEKRTKRKQINCECGNGESLFSKLTYLHLENLPVLKTICGHDLEICVLEHITVVDCPQLKKLPFDVNSNSKGSLQFICGSQIWWESLQMDKATKAILKPYFHKI